MIFDCVKLSPYPRLHGLYLLYVAFDHCNSHRYSYSFFTCSLRNLPLWPHTLEHRLPRFFELTLKYNHLFSSVCGLSVHCAAYAAAAHLLDCTSPWAHQHHGLHQYLLLAREFHRAFHQGHRAGGPRHLPQQPIQSAGPLPVPGASGCARLQHHRPVQVHQQGA